MTASTPDWQQQAQVYFLQGNYNEAASLYEQVIATKPDVKSHYWHLGLLLLLQGKEAEAQIVWFDALASTDSEAEVQASITELVEILHTEAQKLELNFDYQTAWLVRQHIYENQPDNLDNLLRSLSLATKLKLFIPDEHTHLQQATELLPHISPTEVDAVLLLQVLQQIFVIVGNSTHISQFADACIAHYQAALAIQPTDAELHYQLGNIYAEIKRNELAITSYNKALQLQPKYAEPYFSLGNIDLNQGEYEQAITKYQTAIQINPSFIKTYVNLAYIQEQQGRLEEAILNLQKALEIKPDFIDAHRNQVVLLLKTGRYDKAIASLQKAPEINSTYAEVYRELGDILFQKNRIEQSINYYQKAIEIKPDYGDAYWNLIAQLGKLHKQASESMRLLAKQYLLCCSLNDSIRAQVAFVGSHLISGMHSEALRQFLELENQIYELADHLTFKEVHALYTWLLILIPHLREEPKANSQLSMLIGELYTEKILAPNYTSYITSPQTIQPIKDKYLKIGFISPHFARNAVGWLCFDVIRELSELTPCINLYSTGKVRADDRTQMFAQTVAKFYKPQEPLSENLLEEVLAQIREDDLDVLVDLDSTTVAINTAILCQRPAPVCISWLGFDAPFISNRNYYLSDRYLHPEGIEANYREQIVRVPDLCLALSGLERETANRDELRQALGIGVEQIAYLCVAPGRKFTQDMVKAQVSILRSVPNSVLMHKSIGGDAAIMQLTYQHECATQMVDFSRIKFLEPQFPEEKHRITYLIADIMLDSYPYNGGTHTIEGLWFNLPLVTRTGFQPFMGRVGYACLASLGITDGIAWTWEEYTEWGIKFGLSSDLRGAVKEKLIQSKQSETLASLWNPKKLAKDMYEKFRELRFKQV